MWMTYITRPDAIILAVAPAAADIFADEAIKTALQVDPEGDRTVGVLTKVDLMDPGTDAREIMSGRLIYLKRGFVPMVARSQRDIADGMFCKVYTFFFF
jgi:replication fork clamp-binding protein CrfC